jgi:hypothetical protein
MSGQEGKMKDGSFMKDPGQCSISGGNSRRYRSASLYNLFERGPGLDQSPAYHSCNCRTPMMNNVSSSTGHYTNETFFHSQVCFENNVLSFGP